MQPSIAYAFEIALSQAEGEPQLLRLVRGTKLRSYTQLRLERGSTARPYSELDLREAERSLSQAGEATPTVASKHEVRRYAQTKKMVSTPNNAITASLSSRADKLGLTAPPRTSVRPFEGVGGRREACGERDSPQSSAV